MATPSNIKNKTSAAEPPKEKIQGKYLYCITEEQPGSFDVSGIEGQRVYAILANGLSAIVSNCEVKEVFISRDNLLTHQKVVEAVFAKQAVLPVSFGTVAKNAEDVKEKILKQKTEELRKALEEARGKAEVGLRVSWLNVSNIFQEIANGSQELKALKTSKNLDYQAKLAAGQLVADLLEKKREEEKESIIAQLTDLAEDFKEKEILSDNMIFNGAFLVSRKKTKEMEERVKTLTKKHGGRANFAYTGPSPLFNFVKINFSLQ